MRTALLLILTLAVAACTTATAPPKAGGASASALVNAFYTLNISMPVSGAPDAEQLRRLAPYLSTELQAELRQARQLHDQQVSAAPDEKPAFDEGDLFSSLFEGPTAFEILSETGSGNSVWVTVRFSYDKPGEKTRWTDTVLVTRENDHFVISDIEYLGRWEFANRDSLLSQLKSSHAAAQADATPPH